MTFATIVLLLGLQAAQDPAPGAKLAKELHDKVFKQGPVSFKVRLETVDPEGRKIPKHDIDIYLDLVGGSFSVSSSEIRGDEPAVRQYMEWDRFDEARVWTDKMPGSRFRFNPIWRWIHENDSDLKRLVEPSKPVLSLDEWRRSTQPVFVLDCNPDPSSDQALFAFSFGKREKGGIRWVELVGRSRPEDVEAGPEIITLKDAAKGKTTTIDRGTGFLKSIRLKAKSGEERWMTVTEFKAGAARPRYAPPEVRETWIRPEDTPLFAGELYRYNLTSALQSILDHWDRVGADSMKAELSAFLARIGARHDIAMRFAVRRQWTGSFLDLRRTQGEKLPAPDGDLKPLLDRLKAYVKKGEDSYRENLEESRDKFIELMESLMSTCQGESEAKARLTARVRESLESKNIDSARTRLTEPDLEELLRETLRKDAPGK